MALILSHFFGLDFILIDFICWMGWMGWMGFDWCWVLGVVGCVVLC